jgi:SSS family solute:Na+ symporter
LLGLGFVAGPAYWIGNQAIVQRTLGTTSQSAARASYILCAAIKMVFPILLVVPGLIGLALFYDQIGPKDDPDWQGGQVLPLLVQLLPRGVLGIVLGAFMAGVMSNLDSYVNSASTLWVHDIYRPFVRPQADDRELLIVGRWLIVLFLVGGAAGSYVVRHYFGSVFEAFQTFLSLFQGALLALLLLGMLFRRINGAGGVAGIIVGVGLAFFLHGWQYLGPDHAEISYLWVAWWSFVAAVTATVGISLVTKPYDEQRLVGLVYSLPTAEEESR